MLSLKQTAIKTGKPITIATQKGKTFTIKRCLQCPFCVVTGVTGIFFTSFEHWCLKLHKPALKTRIRKECPLREQSLTLVFPKTNKKKGE